MASDQSPLPITYPPDTSCFAGEDWFPETFKEKNCLITNGMVTFLNLTGTDPGQYVAAYCLRPPVGDSCPFGFCPNPDIAGPLVRIANYVVGFCLAILIFHSPSRVKAAFWSQVLITYSLLITCGISLIQGQLTRFHALTLISIVCSPVNFYFAGYSIRAFWSAHRLEPVLGRRQYAQRAMVFLSVAIWIAILVYAYLPQNLTTFAQDTCRGSSIAELFFLLSPIIALLGLALEGPAGIFALFVCLTIPILIVIAWVIAIIRRRKEIWPPGKPYRPRFGKVWRTTVTNYPFLQFLSVVLVPTLYWVGTVELGVLNSQDNTFSLTFGQVLATFAAVPPIIEMTRLTPELWQWSIKLPWTRFIVPGSEETGTSGARIIDWRNIEKKGTADSLSSSLAEQA